MHRGRQRRLENGRRRARLNGGRLGLPRGPTQPPHVRCRRRRHRHRGRTRPRPGRQPADHRIKRRRRRPQIRSQALPRRSRGVQRTRSRTGENPCRVDLRRQPRKLRNHANPKSPAGLTARTSIPADCLHHDTHPQQQSPRATMCATARMLRRCDAENPGFRTKPSCQYAQCLLSISYKGRQLGRIAGRVGAQPPSGGLASRARPQPVGLRGSRLMPIRGSRNDPF
ncbi:hypothetical protein LAUMK13_04062 [Mycobacterium innocens]|uniref:Uncharacterized protein n=1 Tax=Mycobacterium innocens TaxID=2341083 RepID=A0A498QFY2_9MYCO|nr:hypothetical protein LAUMK13_04062 [Mycobacterium innocens]